MIGGTERLLEARRAVPADRQKSIGEAEALFLTNASQSLAKGNRDRGCHALAGQLCEFLCQQVSLAVLDIQSHFSTFLPRTIDLSTIGERAAFENISHFGFVLTVQFMLAYSIIAIARAPSARLVEGSNGKFAP